jgi:AcrR family transcriptional regulator
MRHRKLTQDRILGAAEALVSGDGIGALTMAQLAAQLGVKAPSLYKHFANLEAVQSGLATRAWGLLAERFAELGREAADSRRLARCLWRFSNAHPGLYACAEARDLQNVSAVQAARARAEARAEWVFERAGLNSLEAQHAWRSLRALVFGFFALSRAQPTGQLSFEDSFSRALGAMNRGWQARRSQGLNESPS